MVDPLRLRSAGLDLRRQRAFVPLHQAAGERTLRVPDRAAECAFELHRHVGDPAGGDVGCDVDLATAHDAEIDDRLPGGRVEVEVLRRHAVVLESLHELAARFVLVDPSEELPDREEVLDVVDQRRAGERHEQRTHRAHPDPLRQLEHVP